MREKTIGGHAFENDNEERIISKPNATLRVKLLSMPAEIQAEIERSLTLGVKSVEPQDNLPEQKRFA